MNVTNVNNVTNTNTVNNINNINNINTINTVNNANNANNVQDGDNASSLTTVAIGKKSAKGGELSLGEELTENIHAKEANNPEETPGGSEMEQLLMARLRRVENSAMASRRYDPIRSDPIRSHPIPQLDFEFDAASRYVT